MLEPGLIIDMGNYTVTVLTKDNGYYKIRRKPTMYVSQEILFKRTDAINIYYLAKRSFVAAAAILVIFALFLYANFESDKSTFLSQNLAYISLDTNFSMQFTIDGDEKVVDVEFIGEDENEPLGKWKPQGMKIKDAFNDTIERYREKGIINNNEKTSFLLSGTFDFDEKMEKEEIMASDERITAILNELEADIESLLPGKNETLVIKFDPYKKKEADKNNMSLGRYALYSELYNSRDRITLADAKSLKVSDLIKVYREAYPNTPVTYTPLPVGTPLIISTKEIFTDSLTNTETPLPINTPTFTNSPNAHSGEKQGNGENATVTPLVTRIALSTPVETGSGLRGEYFNNIDLTDFKATRIDSQINFEWNLSNTPSNALRNDGSYSVRWMGQIKPPYSGEYTFYVTRDNGVRLWIDNKLIIDKWNSEWDVTDSGTIVLEGGRKYDIKIEYFNNAGKGTIIFEWSSNHFDKTVVPASCLFPATSLLPVQETVPGDGTGLSSEYFDNPDLTILKVTGKDPEINFNWGAGPPDLAIEADQKFSIRWSGYVQPVYSEDYVFHITYDDCVRLWIDGKLEIDQWKTGRFYSETRKISLKAGQKYSIKLEYANNSVAGSVVLEWSSPSTKRSVVPMSRLFPLK